MSFEAKLLFLIITFVLGAAAGGTGIFLWQHALVKEAQADLVTAKAQCAAAADAARADADEKYRQLEATTTQLKEQYDDKVTALQNSYDAKVAQHDADAAARESRLADGAERMRLAIIANSVSSTTNPVAAGSPPGPPGSNTGKTYADLDPAVAAAIDAIVSDGDAAVLQANDCADYAALIKDWKAHVTASQAQ